MKGYGVIVLVLLTTNSIISARRFPRKLKADINTLEQIHILFRTGDRTPIAPYPNDPHKNQSVWYRYADGFEALTKKGRKMHYRVGQYWRSRYDGYVSRAYSHREIYAQSSDLDRSIMSCLVDLAGMWPPVPRDPKSNWMMEVAWQPVSIHTVPQHLDNYISFRAECPRLKELKEEYTMKSPFALTINNLAENKDLYAYLSKHTGLDVTNFEIVSELYDTLMIQKSYGMKLPDWANNTIFKEIKKLAPVIYDPRVHVPNDEAKRVKAGPLLTKLVENMEIRRNMSLGLVDKSGPTRAKVQMISGHDMTLVSVLGALDVFDTQFPEFASSAIFELHRGKKDEPGQIVGEHYIRVFFRNSTVASAAPYELHIPKCGSPCKLDTFKEVFKHIIVHGKEWEEACKPGGAPVPAAAVVAIPVFHEEPVTAAHSGAASSPSPSAIIPPAANGAAAP